MAEVRQIIFKIGTEEYGFDIQLVNAIEPYMNIVPVPNAPSCILGLMNLRGDVIPVYSLRKKFGMGEMPPTPETKLIVTRAKDMLLAFKVDAVVEILDFKEAQMVEKPTIIKTTETEYIRSIAHLNNRMFLLVDHEHVLNEAESAVVKEIFEQENS